ncbi:MAG: spermine synthase [Tahibacter sp.]
MALFVLSGFAGLIYQSIWSHYLGLTLGHAAYAQTLVLAIFMGGMALGSWLVSHYGMRWRRLILAYAAVEMLIGLAGILFHPLFIAYTNFSQNEVYSALTSSVAVHAWQWGSAALIIFPQCVLLGMTFPLMSGGYLRVAPGADGEILGGLYFTNSLGAALGALVATFVLLPMVGMPGAVFTAGVINLLVAMLAWFVSRRADLVTAPSALVTSSEPPDATSARLSHTTKGSLSRVILVAAAVTGASSFVYEIGWIRLLNQALGTTVHSFELMLCAFILGLAIGGWWIRKRSAAIGDPLSYAGYAQIWMGAAALLSLPVFGQSFRWVSALMAVLPKTDTGYTLFSLGSAGIATAVMFPAAFFAGMTLPLFTMALLRRNGGEASIGKVYAANTLGAIAGVMLAMHILIPTIGLQLAITVAALADIALGVFLLRLDGSTVRRERFLVALSAVLLIALLSLLTGRLDPRSLASGVFRKGKATIDSNAEVLFLRDGKTASVSIIGNGSVGVIATNGKPDAALQVDFTRGPTADESTMIMAGALPLAIHPQPASVAIIGWGSGLTTHTLLGSPVPQRVDTIEIEEAMYDGARFFGPRVARAYNDKRSVLHIDDARTFFSTGHRRYDVIVSEPSNPWVSGVASLFTSQFYDFLRGHLNPQGLLVQWVQTYELNDELLFTMTAALREKFPYVDVYMANTTDLLFVASQQPLPALDYSRISGEALKTELHRIGFGSFADFSIRKVSDGKILDAMSTLFDVAIHSDFYPTVSLQAPRARYLGVRAKATHSLSSLGMPLLEVVAGLPAPPSVNDGVLPAPESFVVQQYDAARMLRDALLNHKTEEVAERLPGLSNYLKILLNPVNSDVRQSELQERLEGIAVVAELTISHLPPADLEGVWIKPTWIVSEKETQPIPAVLAAYAAAAHRDGSVMRSAGLVAFKQLEKNAPDLLRSQMLLIAEMGAISEGDFGEAGRIEREEGHDVPGTIEPYGFARSFLLAWQARAK